MSSVIFNWRTEIESDLPWYFLPAPEQRTLGNRTRKWKSTWYPTDSKENHLKGLKLQKARAGINPTATCPYTEESFGYEFNSNGFRCDEFEGLLKNGQDSILYFGCSFTFGIGLPEEQIWVTQLHNKIEKLEGKRLNKINLGMPGAGIDYVRYTAGKAISKFKPKYVFTYVPPFPRLLSMRPFTKEDYTYAFLGPNIPKAGTKISTYLYNIMLSNEKTCNEYMDWYYESEQQTLNTFSELSGAKWITLEHNKICGAGPDKPGIFPSRHKANYPDIARDFMHLGPTFHHELATEFFNEYKSKYE